MFGFVTPAWFKPSRIACITDASEQSFAPPTGLTLMPTTSPFSKNDRHASCQLGAPVNSFIPRSIIWRTGSGWYTPEAMQPECSTAITRPGYGPGIPNFAGSALLFDAVNAAVAASRLPRIHCRRPVSMASSPFQLNEILSHFVCCRRTRIRWPESVILESRALQPYCRFSVFHKRAPHEAGAKILGHQHRDARIDADHVRVVPILKLVECINEPVAAPCVCPIFFFDVFQHLQRRLRQKRQRAPRRAWDYGSVNRPHLRGAAPDHVAVLRI